MTSARDYKMDVLKEQLATSQKTETLLASENVDLRMENAKLRKLCKDMLFQLCFQQRPQTVAESVKLGHEIYELEVRAADLGIRVAP